MIETMQKKDDSQRKLEIREKIRMIAQKFPIPDSFVTSSLS